MGKTLAEIVNSALGDADQQLKLASAHQATPPAVGDFLDQELAIGSAEQSTTPATSPDPEQSTSKTSSDAEIMDAASYGLKLAEALDSSSSIVSFLQQKVAQSPVDAPGPDVMVSGHINETTEHPKAQTRTLDKNTASHGGAPLVSSPSGVPNTVENNLPDYKDPDWTKNKEAALQMIQVKVAQAESLNELGQSELAAELLQQAQAMHDKLAADTPKNPQHDEDIQGRLGAGIFGTYGAMLGGAAGATQSKAPVTKALLGAALGGAVGGFGGRALGRSGARVQKKIDESNAALYARAVKDAKTAADPSSPQAVLPAHNTSFKLDTEPGNASHISDNSGLIGLTRAAARNKSQSEARQFFSEPAKLDNAVKAHVGKTDGLKTSSARTEAARAYLRKVASKATDPNATPEERVKAASLIDAVKTHTTTDPSALLG